MTTAAAPAAGPEPVRHTVSVPLAAPQAFELFTSGLARWWPMTTHSCTLDRTASVTVPPRVGGDVVERGPDGQPHAWGTVTRWEPPHAFAMTWHPGRGADEATRLTVTFVPTAQGCDVCVHHDGWDARGSDAQPVREGYVTGWPRVMAGFADAARR